MSPVAGKKIHIVSTVNGQVNEGMRNVATHIARAFEKDNEVRYSGLKDIFSKHERTALLALQHLAEGGGEKDTAFYVGLGLYVAQ